MNAFNWNYWGLLQRVMLVISLLVMTSVASAEPLSWSVKAPMPTPRARAASGIVNGKIFVLGGDKAPTGVEMYDPLKDSWQSWPALSEPVIAPCQVTLNDTVYMVNLNSNAVIAYNTFIHAYGPHPLPEPLPVGSSSVVGYLNTSRIGRAQAAILNNKMYVVGTGATMDYIEEFDLITHTSVTKQTRLPASRELPAVAAVGGKLYIMGGVSQGSPTSTCWEYDPVADTLAAKGPLPIAMAGNMAAAWGGKIYIAGAGTSGSFPPTTGDATVREFDPANSIWNELGPVPSFRYAASVQIVNGIIHVIGGDSGEPATPAAINESAPLPTGSTAWRVLEPMPQGVVHGSTTTLEGKIFVLGGRSPANFEGSGEVYSFDPVFNSWQRQPDLSLPVLGAPAAAYGQRIYLSGGENYNAPKDVIQYYDTSTTPFSSGVAAYLRSPRTRAGAAILNNKLYVVGGGNIAIEEFDLTTNPITRTERQDYLPAALIQPSVVAANGKIYIMGGTIIQGATRVVTDSCLIYDPSLQPASLTPCSPLPIAVEENEGAVFDNGRIYLVSGRANWLTSPSTTAAIQAYTPATDSWEVVDTIATPRSDHSVATVNGKIYVMGGWPHFPMNMTEEWIVPVNSGGVTGPMPPVTTAAPAGGVYSNPLMVTLTANQPATIYYTVDGTDPRVSQSRLTYIDPINIAATTTLMFFAQDISGYNGAVQTENYSIISGPSGTIRRVPAEYPTIQMALNAASTGDIVEVSAGIYHENIVWPLQDDITLLSTNGAGATVIDGSSSQESAIYVGNGRKNVLISGFTITNGYGSFPTFHDLIRFGGGILIDESVTATIKNSKISGNGDGTGYSGGIFISQNSYAIIEGCEISDNLGDAPGVYFRSFTSGQISRSLIVGNGGPGIYSQSSPVIIRNNTISNNRGDGIYLDTPWPTMENNIISANAKYAIFSNTADRADLIRYNNLFGNALGDHVDIQENDQSQYPVGSNGNISSEPKFMNVPVDYHLLADSPCIDAGNPDPEFNDADGSRNDMGAFGWQVPQGPSGSISINGGSPATNSTVVTLQLSASDLNGVAAMDFSTDNVLWTVPEPYSPIKSWLLSTGDGLKTIYVRYKNNLGQWSLPLAATIMLDTVAPVTTPSHAAGSYGSALSLTLAAVDQNFMYPSSGVAAIHYTTDGSTPTMDSAIYTAPIPVSTDTTVKFFATDLAGNAEAVKTAIYRIISGGAITVNGAGNYGTIQSAIDAAPNGATINVPSGVYHESITLKKGITLIGANPWDTIIFGGNDPGAVVSLIADSATIKGFTVMGALIPSNSGSVDDMTGIVANMGANLTAINNIVVKNGFGIIGYNSSTVIARNNIIANNIYDGIDVYSHATLENNVITGNGRNGWHDWSGGGVYSFNNNIIVNNGAAGIAKHQETPIAIQYNDVWNNPMGNYIYGYWTGNDGPFMPSPGTGEKSLNPLFSSSIYYTLASDSPLLNAGNPSTVYNDVDGSRNDMGIYGGPNKMPTDYSSPPPSVRTLIAQDKPADHGGVISLRWDDYPGPADFSHFKIYRSSGVIQDVTGLNSIATSSETTFEDSSAQDGVDYYYAVTGVDVSGNENKSVLSFGPVRSINNLSSDPVQLTLSVTLTGNGAGTVHSAPLPDMGCFSGSCSRSYPQGSVVTLTAAPANGSVFIGWGGACSGNAQCQVTMDDGKGITAAFALSSDTSPPIVTGFSLPPSATSLTVPVTSFMATDNVAVTGYLITESPVPPPANAVGWSSVIPASFSFFAPGNCYAYAWARDAAGNVSSLVAATVNIAVSGSGDTSAPVITSFILPSTTALVVPITTLAVTDNVGVTGYLVSESSQTPLLADSRWVSTPPASFSFTSYGGKTLFAWARDAAGSISARVGATTLLMDPAQLLDTVITGWPANPMPYSPSNFSFISNKVGATFECSLDSGNHFPCSSPVGFGALANGSHTFNVRAKDSTGNVDETPATYTWTVSVPIIRAALNTYTNVAGAYSAVKDGDSLQVQGIEFMEDLVFSRPISITLKGGYDAGYLNTSGTSVIHGSIVVSDGTVTLDNITII